MDTELQTARRRAGQPEPMLTFPGHPETLIMIDHITSIEVFNNASVCYRVAIVLGDARYEVWEPFIEEMGGVEGIKRKIYAWKCR